MIKDASKSGFSASSTHFVSNRAKPQSQRVAGSIALFQREKHIIKGEKVVFKRIAFM